MGLGDNIRFSLFQVLRLKMKDGGLVHMEEIFADDGRHMSGSSVAAYRNGTVLIGTVTRKAMFCQVAYLQWCEAKLTPEIAIDKTLTWRESVVSMFNWYRSEGFLLSGYILEQQLLSVIKTGYFSVVNSSCAV